MGGNDVGPHMTNMQKPKEDCAMIRSPQAVYNELSGSKESVRIEHPVQPSPALRAHLVVFFTRGMSLAGWRQAGILEREIALYRALGPHLAGVSFITYGTEEDSVLPQREPAIRVLSNRWRLRRSGVTYRKDLMAEGLAALNRVIEENRQ